MQLSKKQKAFCQFFLERFEFRLIFERFEKKMTLIANVFHFGNYILPKTWLNKCLVLQEHSMSDMLNGAKNC